MVGRACLRGLWQNSGLRIIDATDPANPIQIGSLRSDGLAIGVAVAGRFAYLADDVVRIIDVNNPASPSQTGFFATAGDAWTWLYGLRLCSRRPGRAGRPAEHKRIAGIQIPPPGDGKSLTRPPTTTPGRIAHPMIYCVEVSTKPGLRDARGESIRRHIEALASMRCRPSDSRPVFPTGGSRRRSSGCVDRHAAARPGGRASALAPDRDAERETLPPGAWSVQATLLPGVTDSVAESLLAGARLIGVTQLEQAATGQRYALHGARSEATVDRIAGSLLANGVIRPTTSTPWPRRPLCAGRAGTA